MARVRDGVVLARDRALLELALRARGLLDSSGVCPAFGDDEWLIFRYRQVRGGDASPLSAEQHERLTRILRTCGRKT